MSNKCEQKKIIQYFCIITHFQPCLTHKNTITVTSNLYFKSVYIPNLVQQVLIMKIALKESIGSEAGTSQHKRLYITKMSHTVGLHSKPFIMVRWPYYFSVISNFTQDLALKCVQFCMTRAETLVFALVHFGC